MYVLLVCVCVCGETTQKQLGDNYGVKFSSERQLGKRWRRVWQRISSLGRDGLFKAPSLRLRSDAFHHCLGCLFKYSHCWICGVLQILSDWGGRLSVFVICLERARSVFAGLSAAASRSVSLSSTHFSHPPSAVTSAPPASTNRPFQIDWVRTTHQISLSKPQLALFRNAPL